MYDVAPVVGATNSLEHALFSDLAAASHGSSDVTVDLAALYDYYNKLLALDDELERQLVSFGPHDPNEPETDHSGSSALQGVTSAFEATRAAKEGANSLFNSIGAVQALVRDHLETLRHNYIAYQAREDENVGRLNAAIPWAEKPLGW